jgi:hypothetical protein
MNLPVLSLACALLVAGAGCGPARETNRHPRVEMSWDPFLDTLQQKTARFFLETTNAANGLTPDRYPTPSASSIAAIGFSLTVCPIAVERGIMTREEAARRTETTLRFLFNLPQHEGRSGAGGYRGFFYHFLDMRDGTRTWNSELSTIDTGLLLAGVLFCQSYFDRPDPAEQSVRAFADSLYRRVDWTWTLTKSGGVAMGWTPEEGLASEGWHGYNEAMILYLLALGSPTHPVPESCWDFWTSTYVWGRYHGEEFVSFGPLFGHQYSHCWVDFRGIQDNYLRRHGMDYFENSRRATYSHRSYAIENPGGWRGYADSIWGLTACDGPGDTTIDVEGRARQFSGYNARGASFDWVNDDGTIAPTAAGGSVAFAPEICTPALKAMRAWNGGLLWRTYGFPDAFNPSFVTPSTGASGWVDRDYLGIDQGPIAIMIENLRNGLVWNVMKRNPYIIRGLRRAGFAGGWLDGK